MAWIVPRVGGTSTTRSPQLYATATLSPILITSSSLPGEFIVPRLDGNLSAMPPIIAISHLIKTNESGLQALKGIDLDIHEGEILALLGPNGAGKTTLISKNSGIVTTSSGTVLEDGQKIVHN